MGVKENIRGVGDCDSLSSGIEFVELNGNCDSTPS